MMHISGVLMLTEWGVMEILESGKLNKQKGIHSAQVHQILHTDSKILDNDSFF